MRRKIDYNFIIPITLSKSTKERLDDFRNSFRPARFQNYTDLLEFMLEFMEKAIPDEPEVNKEAKQEKKPLEC
jgi:hypothetical protein